MDYDSKFFEICERNSIEAARLISEKVFQIFNPKSLVDVGGGVGVFANAFFNLGVQKINVIDGDYVPKEKLQVPENCFNEIDLSKPFQFERHDVALCLEVAEHLSKERASDFISDLCKISDVIIFSAAIPFQGGVNHLNEQPQSYWMNKFAENNYQLFDILRYELWNKLQSFWYSQNIMVYCNRNNIDLIERLAKITQPQIIDIVHPSAYKQINIIYNIQNTGVLGYFKKMPAMLFLGIKKMIGLGI